MGLWRRPYEKYDVDCLVPTVKSNGVGVMVWDCFVKNRLGPLVVLEGNITGQVYKKLLEDHLVPFIESLDDEKTYVFQDDNTPVHRANLVLAWKDKNLISSLFHGLLRAQISIQLSICGIILEENCMNTNPYQGIPIPRNKRELASVLEEWVKIEESVLENLVNSMPQRVKAVIDSGENPTMY